MAGDASSLRLPVRDENSILWPSGKSSLALATAPVHAGPVTGVHLDTGESTASSQFWPSLALDQSAGNVAVGWHSTESGSLNVKVQFNLAVVSDGGRTISPHGQLSPGLSDATKLGLDAAGRRLPFGDYTGMAFRDAIIHPIWGDNSPELEDDPDWPNFDMASACVAVAQVTPVALDVTFRTPDGIVEGKEFTEIMARFTDPSPAHGATVQSYSASIRWSDDLAASAGQIVAD